MTPSALLGRAPVAFSENSDTARRRSAALRCKRPSRQLRPAAAPKHFGFDYKEKRDVLYRLLMPKLDEVLSNELAQTWDEDGLELFRQLVCKLDPPKADVAFDLKAEV